MHFWNCYQRNYKLLWQWWGQSLHFLFSSPFGRAQIWDLPRSKIKPIWISKVKVLTTYKSWRNIHLFHRTSRRMLLGFEFSFDRRNISTYDVTFFEHCAVIETKSDLIPSTLHENHEFAKYFCRRIEQTFMSFSISFFFVCSHFEFCFEMQLK